MGPLSMVGRTAMRWTVWGRILLLAEVALTLKRHLDLLDAKEKQDLQQLVTKSKGRPSNLSDKERKRLRTLVEKVEPLDIAKHVGQTALLGRRR